MNEPTRFAAVVRGAKGLYVRTNTGSRFPWHCYGTGMFYKWSDVDGYELVYEGV